METKARQALGPSCMCGPRPWNLLVLFWGIRASPKLLVLGNRVTELRKSALISERIETWHSPWLSGEAWQRAKALYTDGRGVAWAA